MQEKAKAMSKELEFAAAKDIVEEVKVADMVQVANEQVLKIERLESQLSMANERIRELSESHSYMRNVALIAGVAALLSATTLTITWVVVAKVGPSGATTPACTRTLDNRLHVFVCRDMRHSCNRQ